MKWFFTNKTSNKKLGAFSLIELSIVITIISVVLVVILSTKVSSVQNTRTKATNDRITIINNALQNYVAKNKVLPCPARINATKNDATYGEAVNCTTNSSSSGIFSSGDLIYGAVPVKALGLSADLMSDGFGNKIAYVVDARFTSTGVQNAFRDLDGSLIIKERKNDDLLNLNSSAVFSLISYGANGNFAYPADSATANPESSDTYEAKNNSINFGSYLVNRTNKNTNFDDIVFYQDKSIFLKNQKLSNLQNNNSGEAKITDLGCTVSVTGVISPSSVLTGSGSLTCNDTANHFSGSFVYNCSENIAITGTCTSCASNYTYSSGTCVPTFPCSVSVTGVSSVMNALHGATASSTCNVARYSGTAAFLCNNGTPTYTSQCTCAVGFTGSNCSSCATGYSGTNCDVCTTGYSKVGGQCKQQCTVPNDTVGINNGTKVDFASGGTLNCNNTSGNFNTSDSVTYNCDGTTFSITAGACDTCSTGYNYKSATSTCVPAPLTCTGGTKSCSGGTGGTCLNGYWIHKFTSTGTLNCSSGVTNTLDFLIVGGGGGGGQLGWGGGGGGGGGQVVVSSSPKLISSGDIITVTIGNGGSANNSGGNSSLSFSTTSSNTANSANRLVNTTALGGGGGGVSPNGGAPAGGSNRGTLTTNTGTASAGSGTNVNGAGGGGGGASSTVNGGNSSISGGTTPKGGNGGVGTSSSISGSTVIYGSGGGGGGSASYYSNGTSSAGAGATNAGSGGYDNKTTTYINATSGAANTGGGGGGNGGHTDNSYEVTSPGATGTAGSGGSGIVILKYQGEI